MTSVVIAPTDVAMFPGGGGHLWVYLQWLRGLRDLGCDVWWLEHVGLTRDRRPDDEVVARFMTTAARLGFADRTIVYQEDHEGNPTYLNRSSDEAERVLRRADLLVNFRYSTAPPMLDRFRRTALVDIDPGLLQFWVRHGQLELHAHDHHFTTGVTADETTADGSRVTWVPLRPAVHLPSWPYRYDPTSEAFTTITNWFGDEWLSDGAQLVLDNSKKAGLMPFLGVAGRTSQPLELAICFGDRQEDADDRRLLEGRGWRVRHSFDVAFDPFDYQAYIQGSRGEFSCVKPSCLLFRNGWVSDRSLCYLASGKPVIVQDTGPNPLLPRNEGMFRFGTPDEAVAALEAVNARYKHHAEAARELAAAHFDASDVAAVLLDTALASV